MSTMSTMSIEKVNDADWLGLRGVQNGQRFEATISNRDKCCEYWTLSINNVPFGDFSITDEHRQPYYRYTVE